MEELKAILNDHHLTLRHGVWGCSCGGEYGRNYRNPETRGKMVARHDHHLARILYAAGATLPAGDPRDQLRARMASQSVTEDDGWEDVDDAKNDPDSPLRLRVRRSGE